MKTSVSKRQPGSCKDHSTTSTCHIAIIGSGLGGISAALAIINMQKARTNSSSAAASTTYHITIYERDKSFSDRKEGYGMTLTYDSNGPLQKLGVLEEVASRDCPSRCHYLFTADGIIKGYFGNAFYEEEEEEEKSKNRDKNITKRGVGQRGNLRIPRSELRSILWAALKANDIDNKVCISFGKRLVRFIDRAMMDKLCQIGKKGKMTTNSTKEQKSVLLTFEDGTTAEVDLLIGADGVNSVVAKQYLQVLPTNSKDNQKDETAATSSPQQIGIFIILGITNHFHPHIDERGFYTLDEFHRLFIMPFEGSRMSSSGRRRTMWQLSFPYQDSQDRERLSNLSLHEMQQEVLKRCSHWHEPFPDMVKETPLDTIWGTALLDRDPQTFIEHRQTLEIHGRIPSRVVLLGDAAHSMSPFKGQGANQALADGPLLAKWLMTSKLDSAVRGFMTEMARRSGVKVRASREAALTLHSNSCWQAMVKQDKPKNGHATAAVFHGVQSAHVLMLLNELEKRKVTASLSSKLDDKIRSIIRELNVAESSAQKKTSSSSEILRRQSEALHYASTGNMQKLRELSRVCSHAIPNAKDPKGRSCLHVAAFNGHENVCRWLISEVNLSPQTLDLDRKSAVDLAVVGDYKDTISLLRSFSIPAASNESREVTNDLYRVAEKQLRGIRTISQLRSLLQQNRVATGVANNTISRVLGCRVDSTDTAYDLDCTKTLAEEHGAVIFRQFVPRRVDQLALAALSLRPLNLDYSSVMDSVDMGATNNTNPKKNAPKAEQKQQRKQIEEIKSKLTTPSEANIIKQTNFGPQMQSYTESGGVASKKRKVDSFPLSKLRYLNLGSFNYNWGDRQYDLIPGAMSLHPRLVALAQRATAMSIREGNESLNGLTIDFNMAICNFYHLHRSSDRLGGHKDDVESNLSLPLVTISLGAPGIFLLGRESREEFPVAILLNAGDCLVLSGKSRGYFQGVPSILEYNDGDDHQSHKNEQDTKNGNPPSALFPELSDEGCLVHNSEGYVSSSVSPGVDQDYIPTQLELKFAEAFLSTMRMNMSIRQV